MGKRNNRPDFDDFDDDFPSGRSSAATSRGYSDREDSDYDDWAEEPRKNRKPRARRSSLRKPWMLAIPLVLVVLVLISSLAGRGEEPESLYSPDHSITQEPVSTQSIYTFPTMPELPPATEPQLPTETQPQIPQVTFPPATQPPVTQPPATEPPQTEPPQTEPPETEPQATGIQLLLQQEAQVIEDKYGVTVYVGEQCDTVYGDFSVKITQDYDEVMHEIQMLDHVLSRYPENFFREICNSWWTSVRIYLVRDIWGNGPSFVGDGYAGYGGAQEDYYFMVLDIDDTYEELYYHEFSHIIDNYLNYVVSQRQDVLFSDETWAAQNPDWFSGYSNDYSVMPQLAEDDWFVDAYGAIAITEDRAQIMARAMMDGMEDYFAARPGLRKKLEYHAMCLRDAFDSAYWPAVVTWEQYLYGCSIKTR